MASRAEETRGASRAGRRPGIGAAIRVSLSDYYFNSLRLAAVNVVWGLAVVLVTVLALAWPFGALLMAPLLAIPTAGVFRLAARIARGDTTVVIRGLAGLYRQDLPATLALGIGVVLTTVVLGTNVIAGIVSTEPPGLIIATLAGWGLVAIWCVAIVVWPLLADPARNDRILRNDVRLAAALLFTEPGRFGSLALTAAVITMVSTILIVAVLTVSLSFIALVACRTVYPSADRLHAALERERGS